MYYAGVWVGECNMCNTLWSYGIYRDKFGVIYSEDKKELLYFPKNFHNVYYKIEEGCLRVTKSLFKYAPFINYCPGEEFLKRNTPITIEYTKNNKPFINGKMGHTYLSTLAIHKIKERLNWGMSLGRAVCCLDYALFCSAEKESVTIPCLTYNDKDADKGCLCAIEFPPSVTYIDEKVIPFFQSLNLIIVPQGAKQYYKSLLGKSAAIVEKQEIDYRDSFSIYPTYWHNSINLNWEKYGNNEYNHNIYLQDISILKQIENSCVYPIILFPQKLQAQIDRKFETVANNCGILSYKTLMNLLTKNRNFCSLLWKDICGKEERLIENKEGLYKGNCEYPLYRLIHSKFPDFTYKNLIKSEYTPDIVISINNYYFIDIEVDEPYSHVDYSEIHYIGGPDEQRNKYFTSENWFVIRFAEEQLQNTDNCEICANIVFDMIEFLLTGNTDSLYEIFQLRASLASIPRWTKEDAHTMAKLDLRDWQYIWDLEFKAELIEQQQEWMCEEMKLEEDNPPKPEPEPDMGFATPNEWF